MSKTHDIQAILEQAATCPAEEIAGLIDRECGNDAALRAVWAWTPPFAHAGGPGKNHKNHPDTFSALFCPCPAELRLRDSARQVVLAM